MKCVFQEEKINNNDDEIQQRFIVYYDNSPYTSIVAVKLIKFNIECYKISFEKQNLVMNFEEVTNQLRKYLMDSNSYFKKYIIDEMLE